MARENCALYVRARTYQRVPLKKEIVVSRMNHEKVRSIFELGLPPTGTRAFVKTGIEMSQEELASVTGGQNQPTWVILPYLYQNNAPPPGQVSIQVVPIPPPPASCNCTSLFGSLLGGGFGQVISEAVAAAGIGATIGSVLGGIEDFISFLLFAP